MRLRESLNGQPQLAFLCTMTMSDPEMSIPVRNRQALEYMGWFESAWKQLNEDEQYILEGVYIDELPYADICDHLGVEKDAYYKRRNRALSHLTTLLYGVL